MGNYHFRFWCICLKLTDFLSIERIEVPEQVWYQYQGEISYFHITYDRLWSYVSNYFYQNFEIYKFLKITTFNSFCRLFSTRRRSSTNTNLLEDFRQITAFSKIDSISWYYLSLWPKLGIEKWKKFIIGPFGAAILDWWMTGDTLSSVFLLRGSQTFRISFFKTFEITVLMVWIFKGHLVFSKNWKNNYF